MYLDFTSDWTQAVVSNSRVWSSVDDRGFRRSLDLLSDVEAWLEEFAGVKDTIRENGDWRYSVPVGDTETIFYFRNVNIAILFKLTFGGAA